MEFKTFLRNGDYEKIIELLEDKANTPEEYNVLGLSYYNIGKRNKAISCFKSALSMEPNNSDACFNLAEMFLELKNYSKSKKYALKLLRLSPKDWEAYDILSTIFMFEGFYIKALKHLRKAIELASGDVAYRLKLKLEQFKEKINLMNSKKKIAIICFEGLDLFINNIIEGLSNEYWVQRWVVVNNKEVNNAIDWADIVWFEWANEVAIIGTNYQGIKGKKVILRLHGYEALRKNLLERINWNVVDEIIFVAKNVMETAISTYSLIKSKSLHFIPNGIELSKYKFKEREPGYNIAFLGYFNHKKNPILTVQILKKLVDINKQYKVYWAGAVQEERIWRYINYILEKMELKKHFIFEEWVDDVDEWLEDKNIFLSSSIHEGYGVAIMEAMAKGIKPVIHNFYIAEEFYPKKYIFNTVDEAVSMIIQSDYNSKEYRDFVNKYSLKSQIMKIKSLIDSITY